MSRQAEAEQIQLRQEQIKLQQEQIQQLRMLHRQWQQQALDVFPLMERRISQSGIIDIDTKKWLLNEFRDLKATADKTTAGASPMDLGGKKIG